MTPQLIYGCQFDILVLTATLVGMNYLFFYSLTILERQFVSCNFTHSSLNATMEHLKEIIRADFVHLARSQ